MNPMATVHEDSLILKLFEVSGKLTKKQIAQARKIVRGFSDYKKLTGKDLRKRKAAK